jgi:hypothetical protein
MTWKRILGLFLTGAIILLFLAGLLAATKGALDLHVHNRYMLVLPIHLLAVSALFFIATLFVWKARVR